MRYLCLFSLVVFLSCQQKEYNNNEDMTRFEEKLYPFEGFWDQRNYPETKFDYKSYHKNLRELTSSVVTRSTTGQWEVQGPGNIGARINTIAVHPSNSEIIFLGFSQGGLFRTENGGDSWEAVFDDRAYMAISDIEFDPNDPEIIYVGTGDLNISGYPFIGDGVHKSTDGGDTWTQIGLSEESIISEIHVSSEDSDIIYASAMGIPFERNSKRGLYKSEDAGANWNQILMINDSTGVIDILVDPQDHNTVFAAGWNRIRNNNESKISGPDAKIWKTTDGGENWEILENGLPTGELVRIGLAMSGPDSETLFASYCRSGGSDSCATFGVDLSGIYKSVDGGNNWTEIPWLEENGLPCGVQGGFAWYFGRISVNPEDVDDILVLGVDMYRTRDGGISWAPATPPWWEYSVHADKHDLVWLEDGDFLLATDGGAYRYDDETETYSDIENIPTTQFYRVAYNPWQPDYYYGGAQDNGTTGGNKEGINEWDRIFGGDGFQAIFDPVDPNVFYVETQNGSIRVTTDGGGSFSGIPGFGGPKNWDTPYIMSAHDNNTLYAGSDRVYVNSGGPFGEWMEFSEDLTDSENPESAYRHDISTLHESPLNPNVLYVGTSDGWAWRTVNGGVSWEKVIDNLPRRYVSDVKASPNNESVAFLGITGYKYNEFIPHIFKSVDYGDTWVSINSNLPQLSVNDIYVLEGYDDNVVFVATDGGVYMTIDGGEFWERLGENMPIIPVYDLTYNPVKNELIAGTFARGIQSFDLTQVELETTNTTNTDLVGVKLKSNLISNESLEIDYSEEIRDVRFEIYDLNGRVTHGDASIEILSNVNIQTWTSGTYIIRFSKNGQSYTQRFFKS